MVTGWPLGLVVHFTSGRGRSLRLGLIICTSLIGEESLNNKLIHL